MSSRPSEATPSRRETAESGLGRTRCMQIVISGRSRVSAVRDHERPLRPRQHRSSRTTFDARRVPIHHYSMWFSRRSRSVTAALLAALLAVLSTGAPSHHHERPEGSHGTVMIGPDHHSHGTILVDPGERVTTSAPELPVIVGSRLEPEGPQVIRVVVARETSIRPRERAPPPNRSPRAPPHLS